MIIEDTRQQAGKHNIKHEWFKDNGVEIIRSKITFGDYCLPPAVSIDTKENMDEIANNICGKNTSGLSMSVRRHKRQDVSSSYLLRTSSGLRICHRCILGKIPG